MKKENQVGSLNTQVKEDTTTSSWNVDLSPRQVQPLQNTNILAVQTLNLPKNPSFNDNEQNLIFLASMAGIDDLNELSEISDDEVELF